MNRVNTWHTKLILEVKHSSALDLNIFILQQLGGFYSC